VNTRAENMAKQIIQQKSMPEASIQEAFERVFLKSPAHADVESGLRFIGANQSASDPAWQKVFVDYCHVLINSNSFLHLE